LLLVINSNLHTISHCFQVIAHYWSKFALFDRVNPKTQDHEMWSQETRNIALLCDAESVSIT